MSSRQPSRTDLWARSESRSQARGHRAAANRERPIPGRALSRAAQSCRGLEPRSATQQRIIHGSGPTAWPEAEKPIAWPDQMGMTSRSARRIEETQLQCSAWQRQTPSIENEMEKKKHRLCTAGHLCNDQMSAEQQPCWSVHAQQGRKNGTAFILCSNQTERGREVEQCVHTSREKCIDGADHETWYKQRPAFEAFPLFLGLVFLRHKWHLGNWWGAEQQLHATPVALRALSGGWVGANSKKKDTAHSAHRDKSSVALIEAGCERQK